MIYIDIYFHKNLNVQSLSTIEKFYAKIFYLTIELILHEFISIITMTSFQFDNDKQRRLF